MNQETVAPRTVLHQYSVPLSATRRGARLARLLAAEQLEAWGMPLDPARLIVAELAANAVLHGRVAGRSFRPGLTVTAPGTLRIEVTDPRGDRLPPREPAAGGAGLGDSGYGLLLVGELAVPVGRASGAGAVQDRVGRAGAGPLAVRSAAEGFDVLGEGRELGAGLGDDGAGRPTGGGGVAFGECGEGRVGT